MASTQWIATIIIVIIVLYAFGPYLTLTANQKINPIKGICKDEDILDQTPSHLYLATMFYIGPILSLEKASWILFYGISLDFKG